MQHYRPHRGESEVRLRRVIGLILIGTGVFGLVLSVAGFVAVGVGSRAANSAVAGQLSRLDSALETTDDGLKLAASSLADARETLSALSATIGGATRSISDTVPVLDNLGGLAQTDLPQSVRSTQAALGSAQQTAQVVDNVLRTISSFGLLSSTTYNPQVPLNVTIAQVSASLDSLPDSLGEIATGIGTAHTNLEQLNQDLSSVAGGVDDVRDNLDQAAQVVRQYRGIVGDLREQVATMRAAAAAWIDSAALGLGLLFIWLALAQLALFAQGLAMLRRKEGRDDGLQRSTDI